MGFVLHGPEKMAGHATCAVLKSLHTKRRPSAGSRSTLVTTQVTANRCSALGIAVAGSGTASFPKFGATGYWTSEMSTSPTMTSGAPASDPRTLFLTQSAAISLEAIACSAVSNTLIAIRNVLSAAD